MSEKCEIEDEEEDEDEVVTTTKSTVEWNTRKFRHTHTPHFTLAHFAQKSFGKSSKN